MGQEPPDRTVETTMIIYTHFSNRSERYVASQADSSDTFPGGSRRRVCCRICRIPISGFPVGQVGNLDYNALTNAFTFSILPRFSGQGDRC